MDTNHVCLECGAVLPACHSPRIECPQCDTLHVRWKNRGAWSAWRVYHPVDSLPNEERQIHPPGTRFHYNSVTGKVMALYDGPPFIPKDTKVSVPMRRPTPSVRMWGGLDYDGGTLHYDGEKSPRDQYPHGALQNASKGMDYKPR